MAEETAGGRDAGVPPERGFAELVRRALDQAQSGRYGAAEATARQAQETSPGPDADELLARILERQRRYREAAELLRSVVHAAPRRAAAWNVLGQCLAQLGQTDGAIEAFSRARQLAPGLNEVLFHLASTLERAGRQKAAVSAWEAWLETRPGDQEALFRIGRLRHGLGDYDGAARAFSRLTAGDPARPSAWLGLGAALQLAGHLEKAREAYRRVLDLAPALPDGHYNLGTVFQGLREPDRAEACYRRCLELMPAHPRAAAGLGSLLARRGRYAEALAILQAQMARPAADRDPELVVTAAEVLRYLGRAAEGIALIESRLAGERLSASARQRLLFELGHLRDAELDYGTAFDAFRQANRLKPARFDAKRFAAGVAAIRSLFPEGWQERLTCLEESDDRPVFIVGMPRSGTSLAEQILSAHPGVAGAGELTDLPRLAMAIGSGVSPRNLAEAAHADLRAAADDYLACLTRVGPGAGRVTDKTPGNFLFIGLIERLFPRARIVHCVRHPLDSGLSCYFQSFAGQGIPFSYDLADIAAYFNGYLALMTHWRTASRLPIFDLVYEELATDQEAVTRRLLSFLDLPWDPVCLDFHRQDRVVATASHAQVRRPLYRMSMGRFRHYEAHIPELVSAIDWEAWRSSGYAARVDAALARAGAA